MGKVSARGARGVMQTVDEECVQVDHFVPRVGFEPINGAQGGIRTRTLFRTLRFERSSATSYDT
jgi:hypothetical protein